MNNCVWNCALTRDLWKKGWQQVLVSKKHSILENTRSVPWNIDDTTQMYGCKCSFKIIIRLKQKCLSYTLHIRNAWSLVLFYKIFYPLRNGWSQLISWGKETLYSEKKLFPAIKYSNLQGKNIFFRNNYPTLDHSLFFGAAISLRFWYIWQ